MEKCGLKKDDGKSFPYFYIFQEITGTHVFSRIFRNLHDLFDRAECYMYRNTLTCWSTTMPSTSTMMHQSRVLNNRSQRRYFSVSLSLMSSSSSTSRRVAQQYGRHHKNNFFRNNRRSSNRVLLAEAARERGKPVFLRNIIPKPPSLTSSSPRSRITSSVASFVFTLSSIGIACGIGSRRNEGSGEGGGGLFWTMLPSSLLSISTTGCESAFIVLHDDDENENATVDSTSSNSKTTTTTNKTTTYPNGDIDKIAAASSVWFGIQRVLRMIRRVMKLTLVFSPVVTLYPVHWITWHLWRKITNNGNDDANYSSSTNDAHEIVMHSVSSMDGNTIANNWWYYRLSLWCVEWSGAACIKIMQWAGSRPDMFGPNFCAIFCKLQDRVTPHAWKYTKVAMTQAYGVDWEQKIELHPNDLVGCGCIAQVYKAHATIIGDDDDDKSTNMNDSAVVDNSGNNNNENSNSNPNNTNNSDTINHGTSMKTKKKAMAVKVMHPNVERDIAADLDIMRLIVRLLEASHVTKDLKWLNLGGIVEEMAVMLQTQLDLRTEGANLVRFNQNFSKDKNNDTKILFPQIVPEYPPTKRVLMETYMDGQPVMEFIRTNKSDPKLLTTMCTEAIQAVCQMIFLGTFFLSL